MTKTIEMIKQNTYEKKNKKNTIPEALITTKEKQLFKEQIQRMENVETRPKTRITENRPCRFCNAPNWSPIHKCTVLESNCNNCGKKGHYARVCKRKITEQ